METPTLQLQELADELQSFLDSPEGKVGLERLATNKRVVPFVYGDRGPTHLLGGEGFVLKTGAMVIERHGASPIYLKITALEAMQAADAAFMDTRRLVDALKKLLLSGAQAS
jgi:hypothetical protein